MPRGTTTVTVVLHMEIHLKILIVKLNYTNDHVLCYCEVWYSYFIISYLIYSQTVSTGRSNWWTRVRGGSTWFRGGLTWLQLDQVGVRRGLHLGGAEAVPPSPPRTPTDSAGLHVSPTRLQLSPVDFQSPLRVDSSPQVHQNGSPPRTPKSAADFSSKVHRDSTVDFSGGVCGLRRGVRRGVRRGLISGGVRGLRRGLNLISLQFVKSTTELAVNYTSIANISYKYRKNETIWR